MTPRRALWEALATVLVPNALIWTAILVFLMKAQPEEWPIYLVAFLLPLPLVFPIYKRYRKGIKLSWLRPPGRHGYLWVIVYAGLATASAWEAFTTHGWDRAFYLVIATAWLAQGALSFHAWLRHRANPTRTAAPQSDPTLTP